MTRETRIGLLVGLGFIIMFGLVLTELTGSGKPAPLPLSVQQQASQLAVAPVEEISPAVMDHGQGPPRLGQPVHTPPSPPTTLTASADQQGNEAAPAVAQAAAQPEVVAVVSQAGQEQERAAQSSADAAQQRPGPVVTSAAQVAAVVDQVQARPPAPQQTYLVQPKDSLIKIALKLYGQGHEADHMRIYEANKAILKSPSAIHPGQKLLIPPLQAAAAPQPPRPAATGGATRQLDLAQLPAHLASSPPARATEPRQASAAPRGGKYLVKRGDTLTAIARQRLNDGSAAAVKRILAANKNRLTNPDRLPVGMELLIPG